MLSLYDGELEFTEDMIRGDLRNNSAWNYRYSIIQDTTKFNPEVIEREIKFTIEKIKLAPNNESAWNYLKGYYSINSKGKIIEHVCERLLNISFSLEVFFFRRAAWRRRTLPMRSVKNCTAAAVVRLTSLPVWSRYWATNFLRRRIRRCSKRPSR